MKEGRTVKGSQMIENGWFTVQVERGDDGTIEMEVKYQYTDQIVSKHVVCLGDEQAVSLGEQLLALVEARVGR